MDPCCQGSFYYDKQGLLHDLGQHQPGRWQGRTNKSVLFVPGKFILSSLLKSLLSSSFIPVVTTASAVASVASSCTCSTMVIDSLCEVLPGKSFNKKMYQDS